MPFLHRVLLTSFLHGAQKTSQNDFSERVGAESAPGEQGSGHNGCIHSPALTHAPGPSRGTALRCAPQSHIDKSLSKQGRKHIYPDSRSPALTTNAVVCNTSGFGMDGQFPGGARFERTGYELRSRPPQSIRGLPEMGGRVHV